jgi:hypothetical protein
MPCYRIGTLEFRPAIAADAVLFYPKLRAADLDELRAGSVDAASLLERSIMVSDECMVAEDAKTHEPVAIWGVSETKPGYGEIWLMATDLVKKHQTTFLRTSAKAIADYLERYSVLGNMVLDTNHLHIKWLKWLGFKFINHHKGFGVNGEGFYEFVKICVTQ